MKIDITKQLHQDNLKAEIYHQFKKRFYNSGMALICEYKESRCRFDLTAYEMKTLDVLALIEVRRVGVNKEPNIYGRKHTKYSEFGPPIMYISKFDKITELLDELETAFADKNNTNVF